DSSSTRKSSKDADPQALMKIIKPLAGGFIIWEISLPKHTLVSCEIEISIANDNKNANFLDDFIFSLLW
ncbi:hypothetical protein KC711_05980, partial [Candidatus Peregrinibacteria bacterium]|nr:hypothetical protein [Candidatus Peregrinibacteria bacterium]